MAKRSDIHVVPNGSQWQVKPAGQAPVSSHRTQAAAEAVARQLAVRNRTDVVVHRPNGQIRDRDSYGSDPSPPNDAKH